MEQAVSRRKMLRPLKHLLTMIVELRSLCGTIPRYLQTVIIIIMCECVCGSVIALDLKPTKHQQTRSGQIILFNVHIQITRMSWVQILV